MATAGTLAPEGVYFIMSAYSNRVLDVNYALNDPGANVNAGPLNRGDNQIWSIAHVGNETEFQVYCPLTGNVLEVANNSMANYANVRQMSDNNSNAQRWKIVADGRTVTYKNKTYDTYYFIPKSTSSYRMLHTTSNYNVVLYRNASSGVNLATQRWFLIPCPILTQDGIYNILLAADPTMCMDVASGSTKAGANVQVEKLNDSLHQAWRVSINDDTSQTVFYNCNSDLVLDVCGYTDNVVNGANVTTHKWNGGLNQKYLIRQTGTVKVNGINVPKCEIRTAVGEAGQGWCLDCAGGKKTAKTNIMVYQINPNKEKINERFLFSKTEINDKSLTQPGGFKKTSFTRSGNGTIQISGLQFASKEKMFQVRYKVRTYGTDLKHYTDSKWQNAADNSTSRSGWGPAWTSTYSTNHTNAKRRCTLKGGVVTLPFNKTYTLSKDHQHIDLIFEYRVGCKNVSGKNLHGPVRQSTIKLRQTPLLSLTSFTLGEDEDGKLGVKANLSLSSDEIEYMKSRLLASDNTPISEWYTTYDLDPVYAFDRMSRIPSFTQSAPDTIKLEYEVLFESSRVKKGTLSGQLSNVWYEPDVGTELEIETDRPILTENSNMCSLSVKGSALTNNRNSKPHCIMVSGDKVVECTRTSNSNGITYHRALPPLNRDCYIYYFFYYDSPSGTDGWKCAEIVTGRIDSHLFIWNWSGTKYASVIINKDNPPQQTRAYSTGISFQAPVGRLYPVGFAGRTLSVDMSVEGVIVDDGVEYVSAGPIPNSTKKESVEQLVYLSGEGIHPLYRTPYGDMCYVGIEKVELSKTEMNFTEVKVSQKIVED